ncbi:hypothetical protein F7725_023528 [Dissostichus mawsoni]|uniref:Secreted protein n=1 Tax=Dissostichus mawsoni TaxID=36200 RepID=A0A7J5Z1Y5_DISMA|nr:hypothetical protein F7725_023528 [Dissostichus mawsoni]
MSRVSCGSPVVLLWFTCRVSCGSPVVLPWFSCGSPVEYPVVLLWFSCGSPVEYPVVLPLFSCGSPVVLIQLLPEGLLGVWLRPAGVTAHLEHLLVEKEAVHHGNVQKMVKKSLVPFLCFVVNAVVHVGHVLAAHALLVVHHSVRNGNSLNLPHTSLFHVPPESLSAEGLVHGGAHAHFTAVHPIHEQELASPYPPQISPLSLFRKFIQLRLWETN